MLAIIVHTAVYQTFCFIYVTFLVIFLKLVRIYALNVNLKLTVKAPAFDNLNLVDDTVRECLHLFFFILPEKCLQVAELVILSFLLQL